jgi:hypothetical protein
MLLIPLLEYLFTVTTYKFEITATILITNILLIWRVQFMETGCKGESKRKQAGNHWSVSHKHNVINFPMYIFLNVRQLFSTIHDLHVYTLKMLGDTRCSNMFITCVKGIFTICSEHTINLTSSGFHCAIRQFVYILSVLLQCTLMMVAEATETCSNNTLKDILLVWICWFTTDLKILE